MPSLRPCGRRRSPRSCRSSSRSAGSVAGSPSTWQTASLSPPKTTVLYSTPDWARTCSPVSDEPLNAMQRVTVDPSPCSTTSATWWLAGGRVAGRRGPRPGDCRDRDLDGDCDDDRQEQVSEAQREGRLDQSRRLAPSAAKADQQERGQQAAVARSAIDWWSRRPLPVASLRSAAVYATAAQIPAGRAASAVQARASRERDLIEPGGDLARGERVRTRVARVGEAAVRAGLERQQVGQGGVATLRPGRRPWDSHRRRAGPGSRSHRSPDR